jgi:hypothetical protein
MLSMLSRKDPHAIASSGTVSADGPRTPSAHRRGARPLGREFNGLAIMFPRGLSSRSAWPRGSS